MPIALIVSDAGSGAASLSITGSDAGSTNNVYYAPFQGGISGNWALGGTRTGDGALSVSPGLGSWAWQVTGTVSSAFALSNLVWLGLANSTQAVLYRCLLAIQAQIQALNLAGIDSGNIVVRWLPRSVQDVDAKPCVQVCPAPTPEVQPGTLTGLDDIGYGCAVILFDAANADYEGRMNQRLLWRQQIFRALRQQRLSGVPEIINTTIEPKLVIDPTEFLKSNLWVSGLLVRPLSREPRGR